jgi:hypothetical protein
MIRKVDISGTQVFAAMAAGLCLAGPILWVLVRYWLFAL